MTDPNVPPVDPNVIVEPVAPKEPIENDDDLLPDDLIDPPEGETIEEKDARIAALEERNRKLYARVQRDKNKGKPVVPVAPVAPAPVTPPTGLTREEAIVFAQGYSEAEVEQAKKVATLENISLPAALTNDLFVTWKAKRDAQLKQEKAQLGVSRGARSSVKKTIDAPGLSDDDHKALFQELNG
jgi:hypothetical protein